MPAVLASLVKGSALAGNTIPPTPIGYADGRARVVAGGSGAEGSYSTVARGAVAGLRVSWLMGSG